MNKEYHFLFYGRKRTVHACGGGDEEGVVHELRSLPGGLVSWAETLEEAVELMKKRLENAFARGGGIEAWYAAVVDGMSQDDWAVYGKAQVPPPRRVKADGYQYSVLEPAGAA